MLCLCGFKEVQRKSVMYLIGGYARTLVILIHTNNASYFFTHINLKDRPSDTTRNLLFLHL